MNYTKYKGRFFKQFMIIYDPRQEGKVRHNLIDILFIAVAASICRCDDWIDIEAWAREREDWLRKYLELPNGIPTWYTIERVFDHIDRKQFAKCFTEWVKGIYNPNKGDVVAIDGKTMRGTENKTTGKSAIHIVSAWSSGNKLVLGQVKTNEKSNEITAIPELLDMLFIKDCIVTIDAMGCQKEIAKKIVKEKKADYVLSLKENHPLLYCEVKEYFNDILEDKLRKELIMEYRTIEKGHGRIEERIYYYTQDINWIATKQEWYKLKGIGMVKRRTERNGVKTEEYAYYLSSVDTVEDFARGVRLHWGIESMHWSLDVTFKEDENRTRTGKAPENLALLKRMALNMVKKDEQPGRKRSLKTRRFKALLNTNYLEYIFDINFK